MKKRILSLLGIIALFLGVILVSCGDDDDNKNTTGVHKIVIEQSGNTDDFDLNIAFGAANTSGVAKLYNENGEYLGDSYLVNKVTENKISCQTGKEGSMMTCAGSVISTSEQAGKKLKISVIAYIDNKEVNRLEKEYITKGSTLVENFSVSTTSVE